MMTLFTAFSAGTNRYLRFNLSIFLFSAFTERLGGCLYKCGCVLKVVRPNVNNAYKAKSRKYRGIFEVHSPEKLRQVRKKDWSQQIEHMQVPKGRDQVSGGVMVPKRHATPVANVLGSHSKFGKRSSSVQSLISRGLSLYMVRSQNVI